MAIIRDQALRSRNDPDRCKVQDVAADGVIGNRIDAHDRVRFYFRPRTPTQFNIEGIRKDADCQYGVNAHAPILVMFVVDARQIFQIPNVLFCDQNMQTNNARIGSDEVFFRTIPFDMVFHEGGINGDRSIISHRCAEVLTPSPLPLRDILLEILFRSEPEREMFLFKLGDLAHEWQDYCSVSEVLNVFDKRFAFLSAISLSAEGVSFKINHRHDLQKIDLQIQVLDSDGKIWINFQNHDFPTYNNSSGRWIYRTALASKSYFVNVRIENHLAFEGSLMVENSLF